MSKHTSHPPNLSPSDVYQATRTEEPGAHLDAAILAAAEQAVATHRRPAWLAPVGLAATVLLGVSLAVNLKDFSNQPEIYSESGVTQTTPQPAPLPDSVSDSMSSRTLTNEAEHRPLVDLDVELDEHDQVDLTLGNSTTMETSELKRQKAQAVDVAMEAMAAAREEQSFGRADFKDQIPRHSSQTTRPGTSATAVVEPTAAPVTQTADTATVDRTTNLSANNENLAEDRLAPHSVSDDSSDTALPDMQEVVVTGSRVPERSSNPHRRLMAKERSSKRRQEQAADVMGQDLAANEPPPQRVYTCEMEALDISEDVIESAKTLALTAQPPYSVLSWSERVRAQFEQGRTRDACANLAAFRLLFPDVVLPEPLPLALPGKLP